MSTGAWLTTEEVGADLNLSPVTVRAAVRKGLLRARRRQQGPWTRIYVDPASVDEYRDKHLGRRGRPRRETRR